MVFRTNSFGGGLRVHGLLLRSWVPAARVRQQLLIPKLKCPPFAGHANDATPLGRPVPWQFCSTHSWKFSPDLSSSSSDTEST